MENAAQFILAQRYPGEYGFKPMEALLFESTQVALQLIRSGIFSYCPDMENRLI